MTMANRSGGVLLHISSLPGPFGIGCFGEEAVEFAARIRGAGFSFWQVLPFSKPGSGDSPYQSFSAFAGNPYFIDPRELLALDLITPSELENAIDTGPQYAVDFPKLYASRENLLRQAYSRISPEITEAIRDFLRSNPWLDDVALFETLKLRNDGMPWWEWPHDERLHEANAMDAVRRDYHEDYFYFCFLQYEFYREWTELKAKINQKGIGVIGDIPIYVSADSSDVWANSRLFQVRADHTFSRVAGVPPDYFCEDGQLWGNPLYDWDAHKREGYTWWLMRLGLNFKLYDKVRIDHFRGFCSYWSVDAAETTARKGIWVEGPGMDLFRKIASVFPDPPIIAEDLGDVDDAVRDFLQETGFPGMRVLQFGFDPCGDSTNLPHNYEYNCVAYTGTHDNNTLLGWLWDSSESERDFALAYCGFEGEDWGRGGPQSKVCRALVRQVWQSHAMLTVAPMQDLLGYGADTRMNIPGTPTQNWRYRMTFESMAELDTAWLKRLNLLYRRDEPFGRLAGDE